MIQYDLQLEFLLLLQVFKLLNVTRMASEVTATESDSVPAAPRTLKWWLIAKQTTSGGCILLCSDPW